MNGVELGKRIKEARLAKKMTQSDVVGSFITRNMLSQIESGNAYPSIKTLEYLAKVLELPMSSLLPAEEEIPSAPALEVRDDSLISILIRAKEAYKNNCYEESTEISLPMMAEGSPLSDEACALCSRSYLGLAREKEAAGDNNAAIDYAKKAEQLSQCGIYASREVRTGALLMIDNLAEKLFNK